MSVYRLCRTALIPVLTGMCFVLSSSPAASTGESRAGRVGPAGGPEPWRQAWPEGEQIETFLRKAKITERKKLGTGVTNPEKLTLELDGEVRHAVFKRVNKGHDSWRSEVAAYELSKLLGVGMVPPTVERRVGFRRGSIQLWVEGETVHAYEGTLPNLESWREQVSVMWLFDDLMANSDRHLKNAMVSPQHRLILIDNSKTFQYQRKLLNDLNRRGTGTHARFWVTDYEQAPERYPTTYPPRVVDTLSSLPEKQIQKAIRRYVSPSKQRLLLERRQLILSRLGVVEGSQ